MFIKKKKLQLASIALLKPVNFFRSKDVYYVKQNNSKFGKYSTLHGLILQKKLYWLFLSSKTTFGGSTSRG